MQSPIKNTLLFAQTICFFEAGPARGITKAGRCLGHEVVFSSLLPAAVLQQPDRCLLLQPGKIPKLGCSSRDTKTKGSLGVSIITVMHQPKSPCPSGSSIPFYLCCKETLNLRRCGQGLMTKGFVLLDLAKSSQVLECPVWQKPFQQNANLTPRIRSCAAPWNSSYLNH